MTENKKVLKLKVMFYLIFYSHNLAKELVEGIGRWSILEDIDDYAILLELGKEDLI